MFVTFPIRYDIDKSDPIKEAANLNWRGEGKQIMMHLDDGIDVHIDL
jgi:hypothetical protein